VLTVFALITDYLKITMIFFKGNSFSILEVIRAAYGMNLWGFATVMVIFLLFMPLAWMVCLFILQLQTIESPSLKLVTTVFGHWASLDVFGLALFVFMTESDKLIRTETCSGCWWILSAIILISVTRVIEKYAVTGTTIKA